MVGDRYLLHGVGDRSRDERRTSGRRIKSVCCTWETEATGEHDSSSIAPADLSRSHSANLAGSCITRRVGNRGTDHSTRLVDHSCDKGAAIRCLPDDRRVGTRSQDRMGSDVCDLGRSAHTPETRLLRSVAVRRRDPSSRVFRGDQSNPAARSARSCRAQRASTGHDCRTSGTRFTATSRWADSAGPAKSAIAAPPPELNRGQVELPTVISLALWRSRYPAAAGSGNPPAEPLPSSARSCLLLPARPARGACRAGVRGSRLRTTKSV